MRRIQFQKFPEKKFLIRQKIINRKNKKIKKNITESVGTALNLDRCIIIEYDPVKDTLLPISEDSQYRNSEQVKSIVGFNYSDKNVEFFKDEAKDSGYETENCFSIVIILLKKN